MTRGPGPPSGRPAAPPWRALFMLVQRWAPENVSAETPGVRRGRAAVPEVADPSPRLANGTG